MSKKINTRHLIIDLFLGAAATQLSIRQLLIGAQIFDVSDNSVRVTVNRLLQEGKLICTDRGIYQLSAETKHWARLMLNRKQGIKQTTTWHQQYLMVLTGTLGRIDRTALQKRERALEQFGFRELEMGVYIRPNNLAHSFTQIQAEVIEAGLEPDARFLLVDQFDANTLEQIEQLWDTQKLNKTYLLLTHKIQDWLKSYQQLSLAEAAYDSFFLGRESISLLMKDPLLPAPFVDENARQAFSKAVLQLDQTGLALWQQVFAANKAELSLI